MAAASESLFLSLFAIFMLPAVLGDGTDPVGTLPLQHSNGDVAENHGSADPDSYDHSLRLRLPSEKNVPLSTYSSRMEPTDEYGEWQRPLLWLEMPFHRSRLAERDFIFRCRWALKLGRHGGRCRHFLLRYRRRHHFPRHMRPDLKQGFGRPGNPSHVALL